MKEEGNANLLVEVARQVPGYPALLETLSRGNRAGTVASAAGGLPGTLLSALSGDLGRPLAIVVADEKEAERLENDLRAAGLSSVYHAPAPTLTPYQRIPPSLKARRDEFALLSALASPEGVHAIVLPARSLFTRLPAAESCGSSPCCSRRGRRSRFRASSSG